MSLYEENVICLDIDPKLVEKHYSVNFQFICKHCGSMSFQVYCGELTTAIGCSVCRAEPVIIHVG